MASYPEPDLAEIAAAAGSEAGGVSVELLGDYLAVVVSAAASRRRLDADQVSSCRENGRRAALSGVPLGALIDLYLSATWRLWRHVPALRTARSVTVATAVGEAVLRAADDAVAAVAAGYDEARADSVRQEEGRRRAFVDDLFSGHPDVASVLERGTSYGLQLTGPHAVAVVTGSTGLADAAATARNVERSMNTRLRRRAGERNLVDTRADRLVCVFPTSDSRETARVTAALSRALKAEPQAGPWHIAVGRPYPGVTGVARSLTDALEAMEVSTRLGRAAPVVYAGDLLVYQVLGRDRQALADLVDSVLGPMTQARGGAAPLLQTLAGYFAVGGVATEAARYLHVSVRTVTYRFERIRVLTGYDVNQPEHRFTLQTAVLGAQLTGWPQP
jgi:sugar diacid utilization regulator